MDISKTHFCMHLVQRNFSVTNKNDKNRLQVLLCVLKVAKFVAKTASDTILESIMICITSTDMAIIATV